MRPTLLLLFLAALSGCSGTPAELRGLKPVTITVHDDGKPLEGVLVILIPKEAKSLISCNGVTDSSGSVRPKSSVQQASRAGALPGEYKVIVQQTLNTMPSDLEPNGTTISLPLQEQLALQAKRDDWIDKHRVVPKILESAAKSPIKLTVDEKSGANLDIDVSKYPTKGI